MPSFLRHIDEYLQDFTLGITAEARYLPSVANHKFRELPEFQIGEGDATGTSVGHLSLTDRSKEFLTPTPLSLQPQPP